MPGFAYKGSLFGSAEAQSTLDTNLYGTMAVTRALAPMLHDKTGRVVTVSSRHVCGCAHSAPETRVVKKQPWHHVHALGTHSCRQNNRITPTCAATDFKLCGARPMETPGAYSS